MKELCCVRLQYYVLLHLAGHSTPVVINTCIWQLITRRYLNNKKPAGRYGPAYHYGSYWPAYVLKKAEQGANHKIIPENSPGLEPGTCTATIGRQ